MVLERHLESVVYSIVLIISFLYGWIFTHNLCQSSWFIDHDSVVWWVMCWSILNYRIRLWRVVSAEVWGWWGLLNVYHHWYSVVGWVLERKNSKGVFFFWVVNYTHLAAVHRSRFKFGIMWCQCWGKRLRSGFLLCTGWLWLECFRFCLSLVG